MACVVFGNGLDMACDGIACPIACSGIARVDVLANGFSILYIIYSIKKNIKKILKIY
jgi:hypothetical protein